MIFVLLASLFQADLSAQKSPLPIVATPVMPSPTMNSRSALTEEAYSAELRRLYDDPSAIDLPPKLKGIEAHRISNSEIRLDLSEVSPESMAALLNWLPPERGLFFWDEFYPQLGAGVSMQRDKERFVYRLGDDGWRGEWEIQSRELLVSWILLNVNAPAPLKRLRSIKLRSEPSYWLEPEYLER